MTVRPFTGSTTQTLLGTTANGFMVFDAAQGRVTVTFPSTITNIAAGRYVYDLVLTNGSIVTRYLEGQFTVTPGVTV
jgi:hypothetical protein